MWVKYIQSQVYSGGVHLLEGISGMNLLEGINGMNFNLGKGLGK